MLQRFMNMDKNKTELIHGDFFDNWMKTHPQSVDLILVDPPYGILKRAGQAWDEPIDWTMAERILAQLLSSTGRVIIFCNLSLLFQLSMQFKKHLIFKHLHIWNKPGGSPTNEYCPISDAEYIACFHRSDTKVNALTFNPWESGKVGKPYSKKNGQRSMKTKGGLKSEVSINHSGKRYSRTVINAPGKPNMVQSERTNHPTQKPLSLMRELIRIYSNDDNLILSPFAGSGTDIIAAFLEGRRSLGYEKDENFFLEAKERIRREIESWQTRNEVLHEE